jgi:hypothetical protein
MARSNSSRPTPGTDGVADLSPDAKQALEKLASRAAEKPRAARRPRKPFLAKSLVPGMRA